MGREILPQLPTETFDFVVTARLYLTNFSAGGNVQGTDQ
jgi:hypothetical protein